MRRCRTVNKRSFRRILKQVETAVDRNGHVSYQGVRILVQADLLDHILAAARWVWGKGTV